MAEADRPGADWPELYRQLLANSGLSAGSVLGNALQPANLERPALLSLEQCLAKPELLRRQLLRDYPEASASRSMRAHLSVLQQDLALSVIAPLTLTLFRDGSVAVPEAREIVLGPVPEDGTAGRWFQAPSTPAVGITAFRRQLNQLVQAWYPVFRQELGVSPGAYWSSIGLGLGAPFSAVWNLADAQSVCALAQAWLKSFECDANRFVDWIPAEFSGQQCAIPQRKGCCLKYLLPGGGYCGTCGVYRKTRLAEISPRSPRPVPGQWLPVR